MVRSIYFGNRITRKKKTNFIKTLINNGEYEVNGNEIEKQKMKKREQ